jgi:NitT/TauT family transport system permease protein
MARSELSRATDDLGLPSADDLPPATTSRRPVSVRRDHSRWIWRNVLAVVVTVVPIALALLLWYVASTRWVNSPLTLPTPASTWTTAKTLSSEGTLWAATWATFRSIVISFALAVVTAVPFGVVMGRVAWIQSLFRPVISFLFTAPKSAFYPAMTILFGLGAGSKVALGFTLAFFQIVIAATAAASQIDTRLTWSASSLGSSRLGVFCRVVIPATGPGVVAGARVGMVGAIVGVFLGELVSGADGLGQMMARARTNLDSPTVYVTIVVIALMAIALDTIVVYASRRVFRWAEA